MKKIYFSLAMLLLSVGINAQMNYTFSSSIIAGGYTAVTGATNPVFTLAYPPALAAAEGVDALDEGAVNNITLPFTFNFNGYNYTKCNISSNGFISLGSQILDTLNVYWGNNLTSGPFNGTANDARASRPIIAPLWDDLWLTAATDIKYVTTGVAPNRVFTVQWSNAKWTWTGTAAAVSFQAKLFENGDIWFSYRNLAGATAGAGASVGIADIAIGSGNFLSLSALTAAATVSSTTETTNISVKPTSNYVVKFTRTPIPAVDASVSIFSGPITVTCINTTQTVGYRIKNSGTSPMAAGAATVNLNITGPNATTYSTTNTKALNFNEFDTVYFAGININNPGTNLFTAIVSIPTDGRATNDTSRYAYITSPENTVYPLIDTGVLPPTFLSPSILKYKRILAGSAQLWLNFSRQALSLTTMSGALEPVGNDTSYYLMASQFATSLAGSRSLAYSNCMSIPAGLAPENYFIKFSTTKDSANANSLDSIFLVVSTDRAVTWNRIYGVGRFDVNSIIPTWFSDSVNLSAYAGQTIQIGFEGQTELGNVMGLDNITLGASAPLPIKLGNFTAKLENNTSKLTWNTLAEQNNKGFNVQRSQNGKSFTTIGFVEGKGNSNNNVVYNFDDTKPFAGENYYRLVQVDFNGKEALSNVVLVKNSAATKFELSATYPNPATNVINAILAATTSQKVTINVTDMAGKIVASKSIETFVGNNTIQLATTQLASGSYLIKCVGANGEIATQKFAKQ
jgi:Secretion system C-terminal sorting domain